MKRTTLHKFGFLLISVMTLFLTACDDDIMQSRMLSGKWQGDWGMYYQYEHRGRIYTFECYDTRIEFFPDHAMASSGYGRQIDYYDYGPFAYQYYYFHWYIRDGIVILNYPYDPALNTSISEYRMTNNVFSGYFINGYDRFYLRKWVDHFDWSSYNAYYCYGPRDYHFPYYAPRHSEEQTTEIISEGTASTDGRIIRRGSRLFEGRNAETN